MTRARLRTFLQAAKKEYARYKSTRQEVYLAQAGEKLWNAYNMLLSIIAKTKIYNWKTAEKVSGELAVKYRDSNFIDVFADTFELHKYFYRGHGKTEDEERRLVLSFELMEKIMKKYI